MNSFPPYHVRLGTYLYPLTLGKLTCLLAKCAFTNACQNALKLEYYRTHLCDTYCRRGKIYFPFIDGMLDTYVSTIFTHPVTQKSC